ncbi:restriction endonuclease subunit S [Halorubrum ezzemoulense]|uniref:restriction endonuclease subunit S n=1 Tax=Halorubrum ezzemoulense TaxID=337243 RepID=UPI00233058B9|nr:restriction endonuclease subunit S [Halorubrum ezzemoulense]MDB2240821.1 restriction endonuclease subunit S [Halorubrum ezzemoulense]
MSDDTTLDEFVETQDSKRDDSDESGIESDETHPRFGKLPPGWSINEIADIAEVVGGSTPSTDNDDYWGGSIPWATPTDITALLGNTISETADTITEEGLESASTHLLPPYSVLMTSRASIGKCAVNTVEMATNQGFKNLVPKKGIETWYLYYRMLESANFLNSLGSGSTFDEVSKTEVQSVDIPIPPLAQQRKIATVLYTVDQAIAKTEEIIEQVKRVLDGTLNDIFTRGLNKSGNLRQPPDDSPESYDESRRFSVPVDWNVDSLQDLCDENITYGIVQPGPHVEGGVPYINTEDMTDGDIPKEGLNRTSEEIAKKYSRSEIHTGELVVTIRATVGAVDQVPPDLDGANLTRGTARVVPGDSVSNRFLLWAIRSNAIQSEFDIRVKGTTFDEINLEQLGKVPIPYPEDKNEQREIVNILSSIDSQIENEETYLKSLKRLKQGLQQDLLSGKVRTTDTNIEVPNEIAQHG